MSTVACASALGFPGLPVNAFPDSNGTWSLALGDVTGDGNVDVVLTTFSAGILIFAGHGDGTFDAPVSVATPSNPTPPRLRDMNADGKLDIVFGLRQSATITVLVNNGSGGFATTLTFTSSLTASDRVEAEDLNNDGKRDLIAFYGSAQAVSVILATAGGYGSATTYTVANVPIYGAAIGDVTGDGRPDVVALGSSSVIVSPNSGSGTFSTQTSYASLTGLNTIDLVDLDADSKLDVVVGTYGSSASTLGVHRNQGGGALSAVTSYTGGNDDVPRYTAVGDVDGDGKPDVVSAAFSNTNYANTLVRGTSLGGLTAPQILAPDGARAAALGDLDGDGRVDLVTSSVSGMKVYRNTGAAPYFDQKVMQSAGKPLWAQRMTDLNGDGRLDLVALGRYAPDNLITWLGEATALQTYPASATVAELRVMLASDVDNDGDRDLVAAGWGNLVTLRNDGNGTLALQQASTLSADASHLVDGDFTGDGFRDIAFISEQAVPRELVLCPGTGTGTFGSCSVIWTNNTLQALARGDLDGDGHLDLIVSFVDTTGKTAIFLGAGSGTFTGPSIVPFVNYPPGGMFIRDANGDSKADVIDFTSTPKPLVYPGDGTGTFTPPTDILYQPGAQDAVLADMNGDGTLDVVTGGWHSVGVSLGLGDGSFRPYDYYEAFGSWIRTVSVTDVNADGRLDVVIESGDGATVLYGRCL